MKTLLLIALAAGGISASAWTTDYGGPTVKKTVNVCGYGRHLSSPNDCKNMTYNFFTRVERVDTMGPDESRQGQRRVYDRLTTGNYGARVFSSRAEARRVQQCEEKNNGGSRGCQ